MGIQSTAFEVTEQWKQTLLEEANTQGLLNYETFSRLALFHPETGYYAQSKRARVGKDPTADFYTSSSHEEVFPALVWQASQSLLSQNGWNPKEMTFCEIGAEPGRDPWKNLPPQFSDYQILRLGEPLKIPQHAVVYSNELFDAQPFHRWVAREGSWRPIHLELSGSFLQEIEGDAPLNESEAEAWKLLPPAPEFEYHLDLSTAATRLLQMLCSQTWEGLFLAFDYGMTWRQMTQETPQGTARAYLKHRQLQPLFHLPGEQDLTTHICWDHLMQMLDASGFQKVQLRSQSRFLMEESTREIEKIVTASQTLVDKRKSQLLELISPGFFGQKFQVLSALRKRS